jgi:hypothetical protein
MDHSNNDQALTYKAGPTRWMSAGKRLLTKALEPKSDKRNVKKEATVKI